MRIALTSVFVNNPMEAFEFYTKKLGFFEKMYNPEMQLAVVVSPEDPEGTAILLEPNGNLGAKEFQQNVYNAGLPIIVFTVEDLKKEYERLLDLGINFKDPPAKTEWGFQAVFDDTCGNYVMLMQSL